MIKGLADRLKELRWKYGYSQKQVAEKTGVSPSIISGYENGERTPSTEMLLSLSSLYNCSTDYLLGKEQINPDTVISVEGLNESQIGALLNLINVMKNG